MSRVTENDLTSKKWIRLYTEILNDRKVQRLSPHLFRTWINLLALAGLHNGYLPPIEDIAFKLRLSENDAKGHLDDLIMAGLVDIDPQGRLSPHNWGRRQFVWDSKDPTNRTRQKRHRERTKRMRNGRVTVGVTDIPSESVSASVLVDSYQQGGPDGNFGYDSDSLDGRDNSSLRTQQELIGRRTRRSVTVSTENEGE